MLFIDKSCPFLFEIRFALTVVFSFKSLEDGSIEANNFVTTAWAEEI